MPSQCQEHALLTDKKIDVYTHILSHLKRQEILNPEDNGQTVLCVFFHVGSKKK